MTNDGQLDLSFPALIDHELDGEHIHQRPKDGYINATQMCKAAGKLFADYHRLNTTKAFLKELSSVMGIPITEQNQEVTPLILQIQGGTPELQGTWIHPQVAINLGQWLSPKFAVWVTETITAWVEGTTKAYMPPHVQRYMMNKAKIPATHFSMLNEVYLELLAPIDDAGVKIPKKMMPDISTGKMFSDFLREEGINPDEFPSYEHEFPDQHRPKVQARLYPIEYLSKFRIWMNDFWLPKRAIGYFRERLPDALPHIRHLLGMPEERPALARPPRKIEGIDDAPERVARSIIQDPSKSKFDQEEDENDRDDQ